MEENTVIAFRSPTDFQEDPLTEVLQAGAHKLLAQAIEAEVASFLEAYAALVDDAGRRRVVRNGYLPERAIQTGIGPVSVRQPPVSGTGGMAPSGSRRRSCRAICAGPRAWQTSCPGYI